MRQRMKEGKDFASCNECGGRLRLPAMAEPIQLARDVQVQIESQHRTAEQRTLFERRVFRLRAYIDEQEITPPECFISYPEVLRSTRREQVAFTTHAALSGERLFEATDSTNKDVIRELAGCFKRGYYCGFSLRRRAILSPISATV